MSGTLLTGGLVLRSLDPPSVEPADLLLRGGRIVSLADSAGGSPEARLDCSGCLLVPGNVNAHTHAYAALSRGMPHRLRAPRSFLEILQLVWWRLDRALDPTAIRASALVAAREALLAGTTTLVDHHASPNAIDGSLDIIAEAFEEAGLRSVLCYETSDRDGPHRAREGVRENERFLRRLSDGRWPLARGMVGAHASFTLSQETLASLVDVARASGAWLHIHAAEDAIDQADAIARFGRRVVARLGDTGALHGSLLAHAVHIDPSEAARLRAEGATVAHNPRSNMNNGVGRTPLRWLGGALALGTDGIGADMFEEGRAALFRLREEDLDAGPDLPMTLLAGGAAVAARSFGEPGLGRLEVGSPADLVVLDYRSPTPEVDGTLAGHWAFGIGASHVRDVLVGGELVVRDRQLTRLDQREVDLEARRAAAGLWDRLDEIGPHPFSPTRLLATAGER